MYLLKKTSLILLLAAANNYSVAQQGCVNINNRIKYSFPYNGGMYIKPVTNTLSYVEGSVYDGVDSFGIFMKTYQDSIVWAKKYYSDAKNVSLSEPYLLPNGNVLFTTPNNNSYTDTPSITCTSPNGVILWAKKFAVTLFNTLPVSSAGTYLTVDNNAVYFVSQFVDTLTTSDSMFCVVAKLDFNGSVVWSRAFGNKKEEGIVTSTQLMVQENKVLAANNIEYFDAANSKTDSSAIVITELNEATGDLLSSNKIKTGADNFIKGIYVAESKAFPDNSMSFSGNISLNYNGFPGGIVTKTGIPFLCKVDNKLNKIQATYFTYNNNSSIGFDPPPSFNTQININKQTGFLLTDAWNGVGYFISFDNNAAIKRSRVFRPQSSGFFLDRSFHFDNDATFYYSFPYNPKLHQTDLEYSRISNLAEANTLDCFGNDTLVTTPHNFTIVKDTFLWDIQYQNILTATPIKITTAPFTIDKQIICTQTSICDSIKIKGTPKHCTNTTATFTLRKNPRCLLKVNWIVDTTAVKIVSQPNDTTINVNFLNNYHGFIKATFDGCVLKDSFYIEVFTSKQKLDLGKDTMLCPGKPIVIDAGKGFQSYLWQDGTTTSQTFSADLAGTYSIKAIDSCGNIFKDTIVVNPINDSLSVNYPPSICKYDTARISLNTKFTNYSWSPANDGLIFSNALKLFPTTTTLFTVSGERFLNCRLFDTVLVQVINCPVYIYFPNAFTPNNDTHNDKFKPFINGSFEQYELSIYNRFGQLVFNTKNITDGWGGTLKGLPQEPATFVWQCHYKIKNEDAKFIKGTILLLR